MDNRPHIVVVEDELTQRDMLVGYLSRQGFRVSGVDEGSALRRLIERELPALVMLDVGLPGEDGFALARWLRERSGRVGIIMVTAATDTVDRVVGLETGADDYIAKPFEPRELLARVRACCVAPRARRRRRNAGPRYGCEGGSSTWSAASYAISAMAPRTNSPPASSICSRCLPKTRSRPLMRDCCWR